VLDVLNGSCMGESLECDDDHGGANHTSKLEVALTANQIVAVVVYADAPTVHGDYVLNISEKAAGTCSDPIMLESRTGTSIGRGTLTSGMGGDHSVDCSSTTTGTHEVVFVWTPPSAGTYVFDTDTSAAQTVLTVSQPTSTSAASSANC